MKFARRRTLRYVKFSRDSVLCGDKLNLPAMQFALRNLFIKYAGCRGSEFHAAIDLAGHVLFTAHAIRSEI